MRQLKRILSLAILGAFLWVAGIGQFHSHAGAQQSDRCTVCQAINHTPTLAPSAAHTPHLAVSFELVSAAPVSTPSAASFPSSGRSPPTL